jgi:hypothetical protein
VADRVGYHLAAAGDRDAAADHYARTGLAHLANHKLVRATHSLAYALDLTGIDSRPAPQIENWVRALGAAVRYVRTGPTLPGLIDRLVRRMDGVGASPLPAELRVDIACILGALDRQLEGEALLERGLGVGEADDVSAALLAAMAELSSDRGDFRTARRALDAVENVLFDDRAQMHRVVLSKARVLGVSRDPVGADAALTEAERIAPEGDSLLSLDRAVVRTRLCSQAGRFREAAEAAVSAASQAEELGLVYEVASSLCDQAAAFIWLGDPARARAAVASALHAAEEAGAERIIIRSRLVLGFLEGEDSGQKGLSEQRGRVVLAETRGWITDALIGRQLVGRTAGRLGRTPEAREELEVAARVASSTGNDAAKVQIEAELGKLEA